jgi:CheY-like chemotaxis protein
MPDGGTITIAASEERIEGDHATGLAPGRYIRIAVSDTGHGMDEATLVRATEPFFTTKGVGKGTGLGLSMVDGLAAQSGGRLIVRSEAGRGTTVELWLLVADEAVRAAAESPLPHAEGTRATSRPLVILAVDDDELVLSNVAAMLEDLGHTVIDASSAAKAIEILDAGARIDMVISDQAMPGMTGVQLLGAIHARRPGVPAILATGFAELPPGTDPAIRRLAKPFNQRELADAVEAAR